MKHECPGSDHIDVILAASSTTTVMRAQTGGLTRNILLDFPGSSSRYIEVYFDQSEIVVTSPKKKQITMDIGITLDQKTSPERYSTKFPTAEPIETEKENNHDPIQRIRH
ncbi:hypothetical protein GWI33_019687 [Rhynchophorus ferrugineus]|uniref:Uncharacterized protein n=1 Tax=Rhynchophorus ferrugineus TaxID=354439 RepID=A0A834M6Q8_RHYFE|nr:hypothetical protein GWI33_019687 [Rhynchophorus ferrugineus]